MAPNELAPGKQEISTNPSTNAVTSPTDIATQRAEVDRKLRFYGVVRAFMEGKFPSNSQIDETLQYVQGNTPFDVTALSLEGQSLVEDARDVIETARLIVHEKNAGELVQNFLWKGRHADVSAAKVDGNAVPVSKDQAQADANKAYEHLRVLATLLFTNSESRKLLSDVGVIAQDLFARGAGKVAEKAAPNQERLQNVDAAAPDAQWQSKDGQTVGPDQTPHLELNLPGGNKIQADPRNDPSDANSYSVNGQQGGAALDQATNRGQEAYSEAQQQGRAAQDEARAHAEDVQRRADAETDPERKKQILKEAGNEKLNMAKAKASDLKNRIPEEHRQRMTDAKNQAISTVKEAFPEERREQWIYRLKKVLVECQKHHDYQSSMEWLLDTISAYATHAKTTAKNVHGSVQSAASDPHANSASTDLRVILERFANNSSSQPIFDAIDNLVTDGRHDEQFGVYIKKLDDYMRRILLEPGYVLEDSATQEARELSDEGKFFFDPNQGKYAPHKDALFDSISRFFRSMADDPLNKKLADDLSRLTRDLFLDASGGLTFKSHLWKDIRQVIAPSVLNQIGVIPIPRIEYTDKSFDVVIENLVLQGANILPNIFELESHHHMKLSPYASIQDVQNHELRLSLQQMQADMHDVGFAITKKTGFKFRDSGLSDVKITGKGISVDVLLVAGTSDRHDVFTVKHTKAKIDSLKWTIRESRHQTLYKLVSIFINGLIKKSVEKAIEKAIESALVQVNAQLVDIRDQLRDAAGDDEVSRRQVLQEMFQRKKQSAQETSQQAQEVKDKREARFSIVTSPRESLLPQVNPPSHMLMRANDLNDAAGAGSQWRSPAFSILDTPNTTTTGRTGQ